jgi:D-alanine-D-alanine ligase
MTSEPAQEKIKVALLTGGDSSERPVAFASAKAMAEALDREKFSVAMYDVSEVETRAANPSLGEDVLGKKPSHVIVGAEWNTLVTQLYTTGFDVVLPALHGGRGEDGTLQALLEVAGIPYVGSDGHASAITIDKAVSKAFLSSLGIQTPRGQVFASAEEALGEGGWLSQSACVVKPNQGGSSVATTIFRAAPTPNELRAAVEAALKDGSDALIEELIEGVEVTAAVLGEGGSARVLPLLEIVPRGEFYDFASKYEEGGSQHISPPRLGEELQREIERVALRAHRALGCRGVARSDYIVTQTGEVFLLEVNTLPGMTQYSLVPDAARAAGISFEELVETLVMSALERARPA